MVTHRDDSGKRVADAALSGIHRVQRGASWEGEA
jgi:hypothetical protein